ncbi:2,5-diamino-6-(ribosylamino)-4(3H)-pyrimidinone 5'-phosphate reductase [Haloarcula salinisoli]|uniref:2,5-diamino-6-(ribosylamino)-4(3H)-pyrimidinone 5'-phosphate reductase n=1 Tax=Haloarcula salinisoli TaxID=2487746 RepID=A0A8J8CAU6_9EURY|nr:2,5-diamino-6-(ribosylamino)-4(3H)-pyrimidinone 5'-phosphate reductase [Halomicroarcula salinisoli]MBX0284969.1 2,5-diamino-6-(ribosylamino)-4(3H)-pyrimidinone 5'-phosphate reductase [Halomicroarcula salinisoli]MBX0303553.1 2,5-diamino-6-(ribosylamino)-4(3H)-pyrimidinone 5'-phosphate reductase [Halomicroarcula salinisoli]
MHVVVNAAMSADGKLASRRREQLAISGREDFDRVDQLRADSDAVMVGVGTVLADDPSLTVKDADRHSARLDRREPKNPARVVADSRIRTPPDATVLDDDAETYLLTSEAAPTDFIEQMEEAGAYVLAAGEDRVDLTTALAKLEGEGIERLMVEGGGELIFSLFEAGLVDELRVYIGAKVLGGRDAPTLADGDGFVESFPELALESVEQVDDGVLLTWTVEESDS